MSSRGKAVLNESLALESEAYLAMWKALDAFNPKADRWAEPHSFGSTDDRLKTATEVLTRLEQHGTTQKTLEDIQRFRALAQSLRSTKAEFSTAIAKFVEYLRDHGTDLARQSVSQATSASTP